MTRASFGPEWSSWGPDGIWQKGEEEIPAAPHKYHALPDWSLDFQPDCSRSTMTTTALEEPPSRSRKVAVSRMAGRTRSHGCIMGPHNLRGLGRFTDYGRGSASHGLFMAGPALPTGGYEKRADFDSTPSCLLRLHAKRATAAWADTDPRHRWGAQARWPLPWFDGQFRQRGLVTTAMGSEACTAVGYLRPASDAESRIFQARCTESSADWISEAENPQDFASQKEATSEAAGGGAARSGGLAFGRALHDSMAKAAERVAAGTTEAMVHGAGEHLRV